MSKCWVLWNKNESGEWTWKCTRFWLNQGVTFRANAERCYHFECRGRRDLSPARLVQLEEPVLTESPVEEVATCAWYRCDQPVAENKLRHCSELCRKRQNRWDYKQRLKAKKKAETP